MDLERELRQSLRRVEPRPEFAARVTARLDEHERRAFRWQQWQWAVACLVLCAAIGWPAHNEWRQRQQARAASAQLMQALRITATHLQTVRLKVKGLNQ